MLLVSGGHSVLIGIINCFVHSIMYCYYLISAIYPEFKQSVWWKRHLTELQMTQFIYMTFHCALSTFNPYCNFHRPLVILFMIQNGFMFAMFLDFYVKTYINKSKDKREKEVAEKKQY
nr:elongation of very long chain fatty acids protein AAEL008004 [Halyomorpha halys]